MRSTILLLAGVSAILSAQQPQAETASKAHMGVSHDDMAAPKTPPLLPGYGDGGFPITTRVPQAQLFFDNRMQLAHAFSHQAAIGAMAAAVRLNPACAMCLWGQAWASGPTISYGKSEDELSRSPR